MLELGLDPQQPRQAGLLGQLPGRGRLRELGLEVRARSASSEATSSGGSAGRNDSAAWNAGYSLTGVESRSVSQSCTSIRPASVSR